jgi:RNA polymerase sigma-70 factor (ECF subfamily)
VEPSLTKLATLYQEHGRALLAYLRRAFGAYLCPEDLLQETLLRAAREPAGLTRAASPRAWLFGVARHVGLTAARRHKPPLALPAEVPTRSTGEDPRLEQMRAAFGQLPPHLRETLELRLRAELSYAEIATMLRIPMGTVRSRLHEAVQRLRRELLNEDKT